MCKHRTHRMDLPAMAAEGAYEGRTLRLDSRDGRPALRSERKACAGPSRFPWWTLWLIWPLIGLAKWFVPLWLGALTAIVAQLGAAGAAPLLALMLIVVGLALIVRR